MTVKKTSHGDQPKQASQLYQSMILEHNKAPFGYGLLPEANHKADGYNPICGDKVSISLVVNNQILVRAGFESQSCALCRASASVLIKSVTGKNKAEVLQSLNDFESMIMGDGPQVEGDAAVLVAIKDFPARAKCVILPWRTLATALQNEVSK